MSKNMAENERPHDVTIWRISVACWISKATCTYAHAHAHAPVYPHAQPATTMIHLGASMLRYTYIACRVYIVLYCIVLYWTRPTSIDFITASEHFKKMCVFFLSCYWLYKRYVPSVLVYVADSVRIACRHISCISVNTALLWAEDSSDILWTFANLRKATLCLILSACLSLYVCLSVYLCKCLSVYPSARVVQPGSYWMDFYDLWYTYKFFENLTRKLNFD
jgi:hypothetical protein